MKLILGLGITGLSIARFLSSKNIIYKIAANKNQELTLNSKLKIKPQLGKWQKSLLDEVDEIFISPGIAQTEDIVIWAREKSIPITSDIELFYQNAKAPIIGITGSNGKSTVTKLLTTMLKNSGLNVAMGGNIGKAALDLLDDKVDYYVLELSSFQLDYTKKLKLLTGVVLNITPDHLDRYDSFTDYINSKLSLYDYCQFPVFNLDEELTPNGAGFSLDITKNSNDFGTVTCHGSCYLVKGDDSLVDVGQAKLIGRHNIVNMLAALALGDKIGIPINNMIQTIKDFKPLKHRLEFVTKKDNISYYNDSKATNAIATITAINTLIDKYKNIVLILGGIAKKEDYQPMFEIINKNITAVILIGQSSQAFASKIKIKTSFANSMLEAVSLAKNMTKINALLLSPACASFDMFNDFKHRGKEFKKYI